MAKSPLTKADVAKRRNDRLVAANAKHALMLKAAVQDPATVAKYVKFLDSFKGAK